MPGAGEGSQDARGGDGAAAPERYIWSASAGAR
jgi:hypothetical protein